MYKATDPQMYTDITIVVIHRFIRPSIRETTRSFVRCPLLLPRLQLGMDKHSLSSPNDDLSSRRRRRPRDAEVAEMLRVEKVEMTDRGFRSVISLRDRHHRRHQRSPPPVLLFAVRLCLNSVRYRAPPSLCPS